MSEPCLETRTGDRLSDEIKRLSGGSSYYPLAMARIQSRIKNAPRSPHTVAPNVWQWKRRLKGWMDDSKREGQDILWRRHIKRRMDERKIKFSFHQTSRCTS